MYVNILISLTVCAEKLRPLCAQAELIETSILKCDGLILIMCG